MLGYDVKVRDKLYLRSNNINNQYDALIADEGIDYDFELWEVYMKKIIMTILLHESGYKGLEGWYVNTPALRKMKSIPLNLFVLTNHGLHYQLNASIRNDGYKLETMVQRMYI